VTFGEFAVRAVQRAAPDTPIVFLMSDPISAGLVTPMRPSTFGSKSLPFNNHVRDSAFLSVGARLLVG
jgi:hypothetical protein